VLANIYLFGGREQRLLMTLRDQLDERWRRTRERSPEVREAYETLVRDLAATASEGRRSPA
jgi:hypothetical protein